MPQMPLIIGHRGCRDINVRENSCDAVEKSVKENADIIELDIVVTGDGFFVGFHYPIINPFGFYLRRKKFSDLYNTNSIQSLLQVLCSRKQLYLDIKENLTIEEIGNLVSIVREYHSNKVIVGSFHDEVLHNFKKLTPDWTINYHCFATKSAITKAGKIGAHWINPIPYFISSKFVRLVISKGFKFVPAGNESDLKQLRYAKLGAYALSTFKPARFRKLLASHGYK